MGPVPQELLICFFLFYEKLKLKKVNNLAEPGLREMSSWSRILYTSLPH